MTFENEDEDIYKIITKLIIPTHIQKTFLHNFEIGKNSFSKFVSERILGETPMWTRLKKQNFGSFKTSAKKIATRLQGKVEELLEDKSLVKRLLIVSQKHHEVDLFYLAGNYELTTVPPSLLAKDGKLIPHTNKNVLIHQTEKKLKVKYELPRSFRKKAVLLLVQQIDLLTNR